MAGALGVSALDGANEVDSAFGRCRGEAHVKAHVCEFHTTETGSSTSIVGARPVLRAKIPTRNGIRWPKHDDADFGDHCSCINCGENAISPHSSANLPHVSAEMCGIELARCR